MNLFLTGVRFWQVRFIDIVFFLLAGLTMTNSTAAENTINLQWALQQTIQHNAELQTYPFALRAAEAMQTQANFTPNPRLEIEVEDIFGSGSSKNFESAEITLTLSQTIELGDKQESRVRYASAKMQQLNSEYQLSRLDVLAETSRRYYQVLGLQEIQNWIARRIDKEKQALTIVKKRAKAGAVGKADVSKIALLLARSEALQQQLVTDISIAKIRLSAMWMGRDQFGQVEGQLSRLPSLPDRNVVLASIEKAPGFINRLALERIADASVQLAQANGQSNIDIGIGLRKNQVTDNQSLLFNFSMPLAFENPNQGRIEAANAERNLSQEKTRLRHQQLTLTLLEVQQRLISHQRYAERLQQTLLPQAKTMLADIQQGYQTGRYSVLQWVDAQAELFSLQRELIEKRIQVFLQFLELERITGQPMSQRPSGEKS